MPVIHPYESPIEGLQPSDRGAEGAAMAGRRIGAFYHQEGEILDKGIKSAGDVADRFVEHQQVSHFNLAAASTEADLTQQWNEISTDPKVDGNDPTIAKKFLADKVEPALQKLQDGMMTDNGQRYAQAQVEGMRRHLYDKSAADMSNLAGQTTLKNVDQIGNIYSGVSFNDPSSTKRNLAAYDAAINSMIATSNMNAEGVAKVREHAEKVKEQIALSGLQGMIRNNPNADYRKFAADPAIAPYLKGSDPNAVQQFQQGQQRIAQSLDRQAQADQRRQQTEKNDDDLNKVFHDHTRVDATGNLSVDAGYFAAIREMSTRGGLRPGLLNEMLNMGDHVAQNAGKVEDDPATKAALQRELVDQDEDFTRHLVKAVADDKISGKTFSELHGMSTAVQRDPEAVAGLKDVFGAARSTIVSPLMPGQKDARGEQLYSDFVNEVGPQLAKMNAQTRKEQSNFSDPKSLVSTMLASPKYSRTQDQRIKDLMESKGLGSVNLGVNASPGDFKKNDLSAITDPDKRNAAYNAIPKGATFITPDGKTRIKQ